MLGLKSLLQGDIDKGDQEEHCSMSIERWRKPKSNAFDIVCMAALDINTRLNTQLAQWHLQ